MSGQAMYLCGSNDLSQSVNKDINLGLFQTQRRQESQHLRVARGAGYYILLQQPFMNWLRLFRELKSKQEPATANIYYLLDLFQTLPQVRFDGTNVLEHAIILNRFQRRRACGHGDHAAAKSSAEIVLFNVGTDFPGHQTRSHRDATTERLCQRDDVRYNSITRGTAGKKPFPGAAGAGLHFI